ncbi:MAG: VOC family protein [Caulobacter sp.]|jgi:catechol 2,3-dioxygenase-like lactoylglutathione lyase family enzyme
MIGYVTIGALDSEASGRFYDAVFAAIGSNRKTEGGGWIGYGPVSGGDSIQDCHTAICPPFDGQAARPGNGIMVAYVADSAAAVDAAHAAGLANGGSDEGAPGHRPPGTPGFYGAYLRDPTGNKICIFAQA